MNEKQTHLILLGLISQMLPEDQAKVREAVEELAAIVDGRGDIGLVALTLLAVEKSLED